MDLCWRCQTRPKRSSAYQCRYCDQCVREMQREHQNAYYHSIATLKRQERKESERPEPPPCPHPPGTWDKVEVLAQRFHDRLALWSPRDCNAYDWSN